MIQQSTRSRHAVTRGIRAAVFGLVSVSSLLLSQGAQAQTLDSKINQARGDAMVAVIEDISKIAKSYGDRIGTNEIALNSLNVKKLAQFTAAQIALKVEASPSTSSDPNRLANKSDEIGEVAAFIIGAVSANTKFAKLAKAEEAALAVLKGTFKQLRSNTPLISTTSLIRDVVASVALTLHNDDLHLSVNNEKLLKKYLISRAAAVAGIGKAAKVKAALKEGFAGGTANVKYEDGNLYSLLGFISDPETDLRNG